MMMTIIMISIWVSSHHKLHVYENDDVNRGGARDFDEIYLFSWYWRVKKVWNARSGATIELARDIFKSPTRLAINDLLYFVICSKHPRLLPT